MRWLTWALVAALAAAACGGTSSAPSSSLGTIKIGGIFPLSGNVASAGTNDANGVRLAVDVLNGKYPQIDLPKLSSGKIPPILIVPRLELGAEDVPPQATTARAASRAQVNQRICLLQTFAAPLVAAVGWSYIL